jgi:hypothetical protein
MFSINFYSNKNIFLTYRTVFKDDEAEFDNDVKDEVSAPGEIEPLKSEGIPLKDEVKNE